MVSPNFKLVGYFGMYKFIGVLIHYSGIGELIP